jgi:hypothetical protein
VWWSAVARAVAHAIVVCVEVSADGLGSVLPDLGGASPLGWDGASLCCLVAFGVDLDAVAGGS